MHFKIGTRASPLAIKQTELFIERLKAQYECSCEIVKINTKGDLVQDKPLYDIGGKALFLKELEAALLERKIDLAVHSLKDVPGIISDIFFMPCYFGGEYQKDALISKKYKKLQEIPSNAIVATSSPRRIAFIKRLRPDLKIEFIRGNIGSRIERIINDEFHATILAEAGLRRLDLWDDSICSVIPKEDMIPAVGQGIIAIETLKENDELNKILAQISDEKLEKKLSVERGFLAKLSADCDSPVAAYIEEEKNQYHGLFMYAKNFDAEVKILSKKIEKFNVQEGEKIAKEFFPNL